MKFYRIYPMRIAVVVVGAVVLHIPQVLQRGSIEEHDKGHYLRALMQNFQGLEYLLLAATSGDDILN